MAKLHIFTLGAVRLEEDDQTLSGFVSQKTVALFIYLLCHPREHAREVLAQFFWEDTTTEQALKNLRTVLSSLQKQVGAWLDVTRQSIALINPDSIWYDVREFEARLDFVEARLDLPFSPRRLIQALQEAIALYHGDFLAGLKAENAPQFDAWVMLERDRLRARLVNAYFALMELALARGDYALGIEQGGLLLDLEPFWEDAYRLQFMLLAYAGRRTAALQLYETLCERLRGELDTDPEPETTSLYQQIKAGRIRPQPAQTARHNLPTDSTLYVPFDALMESIHARLDDADCRLVTLLGIGGSGKTRLSQAIARQRLEDYTDGVFFVPLESLAEAAFVPHAVLTALGVPQPDETRQAADAVIDALRRKHLLLVLDNFEHVLSAADWLARILTACPAVQIIVTSREQLNLAQEHIIPVNGLPADSVAVQLFAQVARQVNPVFRLDDHRQAVTRICEWVDGLPLGVLIAAGWAQFLTPEQILERMSASLDFLTLARRDLPDRHRGINALLNSTWEAMAEGEQAALMALSVFPGHFDIEAAQAITDADLTVLSALASKSLIQMDGAGRYQLHELLRRFAHQKAAEVGHVDEARRKFHAYYTAWIDRLHTAQRPAHEQFKIIDVEYHNLWAFDWLPWSEQLAHILQLAKILPDYWIARGIHLQEGVELLRQALPEAQGWERVNAAVRFGRLLAQVGDYAEAQAMLEEGLALNREQDDLFLQALALSELKRVVSELGDNPRAQRYLHEIIDLNQRMSEHDTVALREVFSRAYSNLAVTYLQERDLAQAEHYARMGLQKHRQSEDRVGEALSLNTLGIIALDQGDYAGAQGHFESALEIAFAIDHKRHQTVFAGNLAEALHKMGDYGGAFRLYCETLARAHLLNNRKTMLNVLEQLCDVSLDLEQAEQAARLLGVALALRDTLGFAIQPRQEAEFAARESRLRVALGEGKMHSLLNAGRAQSLAEVVTTMTSQAHLQLTP